jgi:hypothetical protein
VRVNAPLRARPRLVKRVRLARAVERVVVHIEDGQHGLEDDAGAPH